MMKAEHKPHSELVARAWSRIDTTKTEDMVPASELRKWLVEYLDLVEQLERMKHRIECADTPLMRDVLAERDGLKEQVESMQRAGKIVNAENDRLLTEGRRIQEQFEALREAARPFAEPDDTTLEQYEVLRAVLYPSSEPGLGHSAIADHRLPGSEVSSPASRPCPTCDGVGAQAGAHTERVEPCPSCDAALRYRFGLEPRPSA